MTVHADRIRVLLAPLKRAALSLGSVRRLLPHGTWAALVILLLQAIGAFVPLDNRGWTAWWWTQPEVSRRVTPTVLALDAATVQQLGPPPWDAASWREITDALSRQGLEEVVLADPVELVARGAALDSPAARVLVPDLIWFGSRHAVAEGEPFVALDAIVRTPARPDGSLVMLSSPPQGAWLPCVISGACPAAGATAVVGVRPTDVPIVSMRDLLVAERSFLVPNEAGTLLALTAEPWATRVSVATADHPMPWGVALATVLGSARYADGGHTPQLPLSLAWLMAWFAIATLALTVRPSRSWLILAPATGLLAPVAVEALTGGLFPLAATAAIATAPVASREVGLTRTSVAVLRRMSLLVLRTATRAGMLRRAVRTPGELATVVADVVRNQFEDRPFFVLLTTPRSSRLRFTGGIGVSRTDLSRGALRTNHPDLRSAMGARRGLIARDLLSDPSRHVHVVALRQGGRVVGFWGLAFGADQAGPDPRQVGQLAHWLGERLALPGVPGLFASLHRLLPETAHDPTLENLFLATDTERLRWTKCVRALGSPVLIADATGVVSETNPAMADALQRAGLPRVRSLRELVFRIEGENRLAAHMQRLFVDAGAIDLSWPGPGRPRRVRIEPVPTDDAEEGALFGYVAWLEEDESDGNHRSLSDRLQHFVRAVQDRVVAVVEAADALSDDDRELRRAHLTHFVRSQLGDFDQRIGQLREVSPEEAHLPGPVDLLKLAREEVARVEHLLASARVEVRWQLPSHDPIASAPFWDTQQGLRALFESVVTMARTDSTLVLSLVDHDGPTLTVSFEGTVDEVLAQHLAAPLPADLDTVPAPIRPLVRARRHLGSLVATVDEAGGVRMVLPLSPLESS